MHVACGVTLAMALELIQSRFFAVAEGFEAMLSSSRVLLEVGSSK